MAVQLAMLPQALFVMSGTSSFSNNNLPPISTNAQMLSQQQHWRSSIVDAMTPLADGFKPGQYDVICSRGKKAKSHQGNKFFQALVDKAAERYGNAEGKLGKSLIVSEIIDTIRTKSSQGGFVKLEAGRWFEVGDAVARERTGQSLRDVLAGKYRSSASAKKRRREETTAKMIDELDSLIDSNSFVSKRMRNLSDSIQEVGKSSKVPDAHLMHMMTQANADILHQLKKDKSIQDKVASRNKEEGDDSKPPAL